MKSIKLLIITLFLVFSLRTLTAQPGGPPEPPDSHGESGDQTPGGNAPLDGGVFILTALGVVYCGAKVFRNKNFSLMNKDK